MSSDSDSDICDFTSDIGKQMSKGMDKFWQHFNKTVDECKPIDQTFTTDKEKSDLAHLENQVVAKQTSNIKVVVQDKDIHQSSEGSISNAPIESKDVNVQNRITNKLNELSREIDGILENNCNKTQRSKRKRGKKEQKRKRSNINIPHMSLDDSHTFNNYYETNNITSTSSMDVEEELNPIVTVNVLWKSVTNNSFKVHKYQPLNCILEHYSKMHSVKLELLFFILDDKHIKLEENSFVSLRLHSGKHIEGGILPESYLETSQKCMNFMNNENEITFKVKYIQGNCEINVGCRKDDKMEIIFWQACKHFKQSVENIKLYFDDRIIKPSINISEMNIEKNACFKMYVSNSMN